MAGVTEENKTRKSDDSRYRIPFHYGILWGSLLIVGGVAGSRFFRISRSSGWSFLLFTTRVTGMYLTFASIQRLCNSLREPIPEEAENSKSSLEITQVHENFDKGINENPLHVTEFADNKIAEDIAENVADEKAEVLNNVVAGIGVNIEENNIFEDSTNQHGSNGVIVLKCESSTDILPEEVSEDCTITQDIVAEDIKDAEVVANKIFDENDVENQMEEAIAKCKNYFVSDTDVKECDIEVMTAKDISFDVDDVNASFDIKKIVANECFEKDMKIGENEDNSKGNNINFPLAVDCLTKSEYDNNAVAFFKEYEIKESIIDKIIATNINIPEIAAVDDLTTDKFDMTKEIIEEDSITQEVGIHKCLVKDMPIENLEAEDDLTEVKFDKDAMTILDDVVKEAKLAKKYEIVDCPLTGDVSESKISEKSKLIESSEDGFINEGEKKERIEKDPIFQCTITTIEKAIKENEIEEIITKDINIEFHVTKDCITENKNVMAIKHIKEINIEEVASNNICTEHSMNNNAIVEKDVKANEIEETITKDINLEFPVAEGCITENTLNDMVNGNIKDINIEEVASTDIFTEHSMDSDAMIKKEIKENEIEETITKDINIEFPVAKDSIGENTLDVIVNENIKEINIEVALTGICTEHDSEVMNKKEIKENEIEETITKDINLEFPVAGVCITENTLEVIVNENIKEINIEEVTSKGICPEHSMDSDVTIEDKVFNDIAINKVMENILIKVSKAQMLIEKDVIITNPVIENVATEGKLDMDVVATFQKDVVKEASIENITATFESLTEHFYKNDENQDHLNKEVQENIFHQDNLIEEQTNEVAAKGIIETCMGDYGVDDNTSIKEMDENETREMQMNIRNVITEEGGNHQEKLGMKICKKYFEYNVKDSEIGSISKDTSIEDRAFNDVTEVKLNEDDLNMEVLEEDMKNKTKMDVADNETINDILFEKEVFIRNVSENAIVNASLEDSNIIQDGVVEDVTECISIEDNVVKNIVEETFSKNLAEEIIVNIVIKNTIAEDGIEKNTVNDEISAYDIDSQCILVDKPTLIKDTESQYEGDATTEEVNVNEALRMGFNIAMPQTQQSPKLADIPTVQHINQLLSNSTDELRFLSPNTASGIGVFFRKSKDTRLAARFTNTSTGPAEDLKDSKSSLPKQSMKTSVINVLATNRSLSTSSSAIISTSVETSSKPIESPIELCSKHYSRPTGNEVFNAEYSPTASDTITANTNIQFSENLFNFKDRIACQPTNTSSNTIDASTKNSPNSLNSRTISPVSDTLDSSDSNVKSSTRKYSTASRNFILDPKHRQSAGTSRSSVLFLNNQTCTTDLPTGQFSSDSETVVVSLSQVPELDRGVNPHLIQSPNFLDIAFISSTDQHLKILPDTTTISAKDSSPVIANWSVPIPIHSQKSSENISGTPVGHLPKPINSPSDKSSKQSPKTSDPKFASFTRHSQRSPTDDAFSQDRSSSMSPDIGNRSRDTYRPSAISPSWSDSASQSRHSFRRGKSSHTNPPTKGSKEDVFSRAADSTWTSCGDIPQAGNTSNSCGRDVFSFARNSPWSSCGDVSSPAHHFKNTNDGDVFSYANNSPWKSGSGTIFHAGHPRKSSSGRPFSHSRHSRRALSASGRSRVRHSRSPMECLALTKEKSPTFPGNVTSPSGQPSSASLYVESPTGQSIDSVSATSLTVESTGASVDRLSDRHSPKVPVYTRSSDTQSPNVPVYTWSSDKQSPNVPVDTRSSD